MLGHPTPVQQHGARNASEIIREIATRVRMPVRFEHVAHLLIDGLPISEVARMTGYLERTVRFILGALYDHGLFTPTISADKL
jgi:hypothetical protein